MRKTRVSQASLSEKLMRLKQELATTAELVNGVLRREQLRREASQQAKVVWEKCEDFATCEPQTQVPFVTQCKGGRRVVL
jgi:hypothetical protein